MFVHSLKYNITEHCTYLIEYNLSILNKKFAFKAFVLLLLIFTVFVIIINFKYFMYYKIAIFLIHIMYNIIMPYLVNLHHQSSVSNLA